LELNVAELNVVANIATAVGNVTASIDAQSILAAVKVSQYQRIPGSITPNATRKGANQNGDAQGVDALATANDVFSIIPNPTADKTTIVFSLKDNGRIVLADMLGNIIKMVDLQKDQQEYLLETTDLAQGVYFITIFEKDAKLSTRKLVVSK